MASILSDCLLLQLQKQQKTPKAFLEFLERMPSQIVILTLAIGADYKKALAPGLKSKRDYAAAHGYEYVEGGEEFWDRMRPIAWSKIGFVLSELEKRPDGTLLWLSDADVLVTNKEIRLEDHMVPMLPEGKDLLLTKDSCGHINSGNMLLRNGPWLRDFWRRMDLQKDLTYHIWWENAALIHLIQTIPSDLAKTEISGLHKRINAYLHGLPGEPLWEPGDFLVHFAGVYDLEKMEDLQKRILAGECPRI